MQETARKFNADYREVIRIADGGDLMEALMKGLQDNNISFISEFINEDDHPTDRMAVVLQAIYKLKDNMDNG